MRVEPRPYDWEHPHKLFGDAPRHVAGFCLTVTLQLRTPLYVLERAGEAIPYGPLPEPDFPFWAAVWSPMSHGMWKASKIVAGRRVYLTDSMSATPLGPLPQSDFVDFLIAFRRAIESDLDDSCAVSSIHQCMALNNQWGDWIARLGGAAKMIEHSGEPRRAAR